MKPHFLMATVVLTSVLATGCASTSTQNTAMEAEFSQAVAEAETSREKAASVGGEWRDTGKIIQQAREAAANGDYDKAMTLAEKARLQGVIGYEQAMDQQAAGPAF